MIEVSRILMVDDEADLELLVRQKFRRQIASGDLSFVFARSGEEALATIQEDPNIRLVITDLNMPVMDGLTLMRHVSERPGMLKTVVLSAYDDLTNIRAAMNLGAYDFLTKPIDFVDLETTIRKTLRDVEALQAGLRAREQLSSLEHELRIATRIQQSILPQTLSGLGEFEIAATMLPARQIGGDFYDFFLVAPHRLAIAIGDVSGKGIPAALFMAVSRTLLRAIGLDGHSPADCLDRMNRVLLKQSDGEMFVTVFYAILDLESGELEFSAAGQTPPYHVSTGRALALSEPKGAMLGLLDQVEYRNGKTRLLPGDALVFYTDGVTEAGNADEEFFQSSRLETLLQSLGDEPAAEIVARVVSDVRDFSQGIEQSDDVTVMALRFRP